MGRGSPIHECLPFFSQTHHGLILKKDHPVFLCIFI